MFSYMYDLDLPTYDLNLNKMGQLPAREKSAQERRLKRSKSINMMEVRARPRSTRFARERFHLSEDLKIVDLETEAYTCSSPTSPAWCVTFNSTNNINAVSSTLILIVVELFSQSILRSKCFYLINTPAVYPSINFDHVV